MISLKDNSLESNEYWEEMRIKYERHLAYEARVMELMSEEAALREAELRVQKAERRANKAEEEVKIRGREKEKAMEEIARRLLAKGMEIGDIVETTEITEARVSEIKRDM